jgi:Rrf2 family protein
MLLTKKTEYAILSLVAIAKSTTPKNVDLLSKELNIPKPYLAKILQSFSKSDILTSYKGINGGFVLAMPPENISLLKITAISEDKAITVFECSPTIESCPSNKAHNCNLWPTLNKLQIKIDDFLEKITLKDIMQ